MGTRGPSVPGAATDLPDLTDRQALVLAAVRSQETMPSVRELCALTGIRWPTVVHRELVRLQVKGYLPPGQAAARRLERCAGRRHAGRTPAAQRRPTRRLCFPGSATVVDEVAVYRALVGDPARPLGIAERVEAVRIAAARRWPDSKTAERLGIASRSVERIRDRHGIPPGVPCTRRAAA